MKVEFFGEDDRHDYYVNGEEYTSVTTILDIVKPIAPMMGWAVKVTVNYLAQHLEDIRKGKLELTEDNAGKLLYQAKKEYKEEREGAADIGKNTHKLAENLFKTNIMPKDIREDLRKPFDALLSWREKNPPEIIQSEVIVVSKKYKYAGTLDILGNLNNLLYIIDMKTSKAIYNDMLLQLVAYKQALEEMGGIWKKEIGIYKFIPINKKIDKVAVLRLDKKTGMPEFKDDFTKKDMDIARRKFNYICRYYNLDKK